MDNIIRSINAAANDISIKRAEILRYMQYKPGSEYTNLDSLIDECILEFNEHTEYRACYAMYDIKLYDDTVDFGFMKVASKSLCINLNNCKSVYCFAATTGVNAERLLNKYKRLSPARAFILDCIGSAAIEAFCDYINIFLKEMAEAGNLFLRPRFSPGYGDFSINYQSEFLRVLDTQRKLNLVLTDSLLMVPTKSVTAITGISDTPVKCRTKNCETCTLTDCMYRK